MVATVYQTVREMSNEHTLADEGRMYLDELASDPIAREYQFWNELMNAAVQTVKDHRAAEDWTDGQRRELGGGAWLRQYSYQDGRDELLLEIEWASVRYTLVSIGWYEPKISAYGWSRNRAAYTRNVRAFQRALETRADAIGKAYHAALAALPNVTQDRLAKAYRLALDGAVTLTEDGATVRSARDPEVEYPINGRCTCGDAGTAAPMVNRVPACKHQIAVWLMRKVEETRK